MQTREAHPGKMRGKFMRTERCTHNEICEWNEINKTKIRILCKKSNGTRIGGKSTNTVTECKCRTTNGMNVMYINRTKCINSNLLNMKWNEIKWMIINNEQRGTTMNNVNEILVERSICLVAGMQECKRGEVPRWWKRGGEMTKPSPRLVWRNESRWMCEDL